MSAIPLARPRSCAACFAFSNSEPKVAPFPNAGLGARKAGLTAIATVVKSSRVSTPYAPVELSQQEGDDSPPQFEVALEHLSVAYKRHILCCCFALAGNSSSTTSMEVRCLQPKWVDCSKVRFSLLLCRFLQSDAEEKTLPTIQVRRAPMKEPETVIPAMTHRMMEAQTESRSATFLRAIQRTLTRSPWVS